VPREELASQIEMLEEENKMNSKMVDELQKTISSMKKKLNRDLQSASFEDPVDVLLSVNRSYSTAQFFDFSYQVEEYNMVFDIGTNDTYSLEIKIADGRVSVWLSQVNKITHDDVEDITLRVCLFHPTDAEFNCEQTLSCPFQKTAKCFGLEEFIDYPEFIADFLGFSNKFAVGVCHVESVDDDEDDLENDENEIVISDDGEEDEDEDGEDDEDEDGEDDDDDDDDDGDEVG
jgi:hypothetical protein